MLDTDYCKIIISGLCNSPDHLLTDYYKREINKLQAKDYTPAEIEHHLRLVLDMLKDAVRHSFESSMTKFEEYESKERGLPLKKRTQYPKPDLDRTQIVQLTFPKSGSTVRFPGGRSYFLKDFETVEEALNEVFTESGRQTNIHLKDPQSFQELFYDGYNAMDFVDILKNTVPPIIDSKRNYIGKSKGAICVWYEEMKRQGIVRQVPDKVLSVLIPKAINRFSINESMFRRTHKDAELTFKSDLKALISKVKSSQDSQM
jgi:hypothetical protein